LATSHTAQVGLPFRNTGLARLILGILIGAVAAAMVGALVTSGVGIETVPARSVDTYSLSKVFQQENAGISAPAAVAPAPGPGEVFDYSGMKLEQVRGEATKAGISAGANLNKLTE